MDLILKPFFLGGVMKASGNRPPMMVPSKAIYMHKDLSRNAAYFGVPLKALEVLSSHLAKEFRTGTDYLRTLSGPISCYG